MPGSRTTLSCLKDEGSVSKILVHFQTKQVKIEVTPVLRGSIEKPELRRVSPKVEDAFGYAELQVLSLADLYGGKLVAALDRQHSRDLFDVRALLANEGLTDDIRNAFIVYLISHNRSFHEVRAPNRLDVSHEFENHFEGMTDEAVTLEQLCDVRESLIGDLVGNMPDGHRAFLFSFMRGDPDWSLLATPDVERLSAIRFRMQNLEKVTADRRKELLTTLSSILGDFLDNPGEGPKAAPPRLLLQI